MTNDQLKQMLNAEPFRPFIIHLADGREVAVDHREFVMSPPQGRTIAVCQKDDTCNIIDLLLLTDLEIRPPKKQKRTNGRGKSPRKR